MPKVFITGGAVRLGRGLALKFAEKGCDVAFSYYHSAEKAKVTSNEITKYNVRNYNFQVDLRNYKQLRAEFEKMIDVFGIPDVVINNAAVFPPQKSLTELKVEEWHSVLDANLNSVFYVSKIFAEYAENNSKIINIASIGAMEIWDGRIPYHVSKAGVLQLTQALARDLAPRISVNSISPGTIVIEGEPDGENVPAISADRTPMKRNANIDDIFNVCYFLATTENFITGTNIIVDGGYSLTR